MTQPAKLQEPSMEEILASIRRIIADDEAKPATAEKPLSPAPPAKPDKPAAPAAAPVVSNSQDDIDALLNGLDEATTAEEIRAPLPESEVFELTDEMAVAPPEPPQPSFHK